MRDFELVRYMSLHIIERKLYANADLYFWLNNNIPNHEYDDIEEWIKNDRWFKNRPEPEYPRYLNLSIVTPEEKVEIQEKLKSMHVISLLRK